MPTTKRVFWQTGLNERSLSAFDEYSTWYAPTVNLHTINSRTEKWLQQYEVDKN